MKKSIGFSYSNRNKGNKKTTAKVSSDKRRRIGYKHYDNVSELPAIPEVKEEVAAAAPATNLVSTAHSQLIEKINGVASLILSDDFPKLSPAEKTTYVSLLISNVALEAELSATKVLAKK
jgi:hypothetical protein